WVRLVRVGGGRRGQAAGDTHKSRSCSPTMQGVPCAAHTVPAPRTEYRPARHPGTRSDRKGTAGAIETALAEYGVVFGARIQAPIRARTGHGHGAGSRFTATEGEDHAPN